MDAAQVRAILTRELATLGRSFEDVFASFDDEPLGSASVAQVHKATLAAPAATTVAVKVQNPGAPALMALDLQNLRGLAFILQRTDLRFDLSSAVDELGAQVASEFDFEREARCMDDIGARLAGMRRSCAVPSSVRGLVTRRMLCMTYLDGIQARAHAHAVA
jgi:aarF domain-containing kinase